MAAVGAIHMQGKGPWWLTNVFFFLWFEFLKKYIFHLNFALFFFYRAISIFLLENMCFMRTGPYQKSQRMQTLVGRQSNRVCVCVCVRRRASQEVIYGAAQPTCPSSRPAGGEIKMQPSAVAAETRLICEHEGGRAELWGGAGGCRGGSDDPQNSERSPSGRLPVIFSRQKRGNGVKSLLRLLFSRSVAHLCCGFRSRCQSQPPPARPLPLSPPPDPTSLHYKPPSPPHLCKTLPQQLSADMDVRELQVCQQFVVVEGRGLVARP